MKEGMKNNKKDKYVGKPEWSLTIKKIILNIYEIKIYNCNNTEFGSRLNVEKLF